MQSKARTLLKSRTLPPIPANNNEENKQSNQLNVEKRKSFRITTKKASKKKKKAGNKDAIQDKQLIGEKVENKIQHLISSSYSNSKTSALFLQFSIDLSQRKSKPDIFELVISSLFLHRNKLDTVELNFNSSELSQSALQKLAKCLRQINFLSNLTLKLNKTITGKAILSPIALGLNSLRSTLTYLDISLTWNSLQEADLSMLAQSLFNLEKLRKLSLDISWNSITDRSFKEVSVAIENLGNLVTFKLSLFMSEINDETLRHIGRLLINKGDLLLLDLNFKWNNITAQGMLDTLLAISACPKLRVLRLDFYNNQLENSGFEIIQHNISLLSKELEEIHLNLYENQINKHFTFLIRELDKFQRLRKLNLTMEQCIIDDKGFTVVETGARALVSSFYQKIKRRDWQVTAFMFETIALKNFWRGKKIFRKEVVAEVFNWLWEGNDQKQL